MPILPPVGQRAWSMRILIAGMYIVLCVLGASMVIPFMITVSASITNDFDYQRFLPVPRFCWSKPDRFVRGLVRYFNRYPRWYEQMGTSFRGMPGHWANWREIGRDYRGVDALAGPYLARAPEQQSRDRRIAADYSEFVDAYPVQDLLVAVDDLEACLFLSRHYQDEWLRQHPEDAGWRRTKPREEAALRLMCERWDLNLTSFFGVQFSSQEAMLPYWQQSWFPPDNGKYRDYLFIKDLCRHHYFTPGIAGRWAQWLKQKGHAGPTDLAALSRTADPELRRLWSEFKAEVAPAAPTVPLALRTLWIKFFDTDDVRQMLQLKPQERLDIDTYNRLAGTRYGSLKDVPFPLPADAPAALQRVWTAFVETRYPVRLTTIEVTPETTRRYQEFLRQRFKNVAYANRMLGTGAAVWDEFVPTAAPPESAAAASLRDVWVDFVKNLPAAFRKLTSSEMAYQELLLRKYGDVAGVNRTYGWNLQRIEEAFPPVDVAYAVTFAQNEWAFTAKPLLRNYQFILAYLLKQGRALFVTAVLVAASILLTLTVNPMCAYALSRFSLRGKDKLILYLLATMAFPAMISAIPAYLLMRDLGMLNTFLALILPGAANGMAIFILKGFFDSLPPELYEAATIDGAKEWQIFLIITLPLMKPILAINALNAFIAAYNGWEWALIICQKQSMWTLSVWMYQANQMWAMDYPWIVSAGFVVVSIPTLVVFLFCQKIILRGIILPQMK